jgi:hypothetical protein
MNATCKHCRERVEYKRGLCRQCHANADIALKYPLFDKPATELPALENPCQHCAKRKAVRPRKLCCVCYDDKAVRAIYPRKFDSPSVDNREETMEELEALIETQRQCLPAWWDAAGPKGGILDPDGE